MFVYRRIFVFVDMEQGGRGSEKERVLVLGLRLRLLWQLRNCSNRGLTKAQAAFHSRERSSATSHFRHRQVRRAVVPDVPRVGLARALWNHSHCLHSARQYKLPDD
jgi:hypothetical protein